MIKIRFYIDGYHANWHSVNEIFDLDDGEWLSLPQETRFDMLVEHMAQVPVDWEIKEDND